MTTVQSKALVMWSGGIDSTYTLAMMLLETDKPVHAHHIVLVDQCGRWKEEQDAVYKMIPILQNIRPFEYSQSTYSPGVEDIHKPADLHVVCFQAGVKYRELNNRKDWVDKWMIGGHSGEGHNWQRWDQITKATEAAYYPRPLSELNFELHDMVSKGEEMKYLNKLDLLDHVWYCRNPNNGEPCGICHACEEVNKTGYRKEDHA